MLYISLAETYRKLESTASKLDKAEILSDFFTHVWKTSPESVEKVAYLSLGRVFAGWSEKELGVASLLMAKALAKSYGAKPGDIEREWKKTGDLGIVAEKLASKKKQTALIRRQLTLEKVFENLGKLPSLEGPGSQEKKLLLISELFSQGSPLEARYIARTVIGDLRIGVGEGILRDAITWAFFARTDWKSLLWQKSDSMKNCEMIFESSKGKRVIVEDALDRIFGEDFEEQYSRFKKENSVSVMLEPQIKKMGSLWKKNAGVDMIFVASPELGSAMRSAAIEAVDSAYEVSNDWGIVAKMAMERGEEGLLSLEPQVGRPIKVMLAQKVASVREAFETVGTPAAIEYKFDGFRMQAHKKGNTISIFTRRLENVTKQFPEVAEIIRDHIKADSCIVEGEAVGFDAKTRKYLPFQMISRRIKRKYDIKETAKEIPIVLNLFDIIYLDGKSLIREPFKKRRKMLESITKEAPQIVLAKQLLTSSDEEAKKFYKESLDLGNEGAMFKNLDAPYKPGSRVGHMIKLKPVMESLDLVIVGGEWGEGKRAGWLSSFVLACLDRETGEFREIGRMGTGIKEKPEEGISFVGLTDMLREHITKEEGKVVEVKPSVVVEVAYEEIQKSPTYSSGYALRFPRLLRLRADRAPEECDDIARVEELYIAQRRRGK